MAWQRLLRLRGLDTISSQVVLTTESQEYIILLDNNVNCIWVHELFQFSMAHNEVYVES